MSDLAFATISELSRGLEDKQFSPTELLDDVLGRLEVLEPQLNMFAALDVEGAKQDAIASEVRQLRGERLSCLDGIPTSIKDLIAQKNLPQRFGSRTAGAAPMAEDAPSVARLRAAGAVLLGKSTTSEFGCKAVGDSPLTGITRNPWNRDLTPGGSQLRRRRDGRRGSRALRAGHRRRRLDPHSRRADRPVRHQGPVRPGAGLSHLGHPDARPRRPAVPDRRRRGHRHGTHLRA